MVDVADVRERARDRVRLREIEPDPACAPPISLAAALRAGLVPARSRSRRGRRRHRTARARGRVLACRRRRRRCPLPFARLSPAVSTRAGRGWLDRPTPGQASPPSPRMWFLDSSSFRKVLSRSASTSCPLPLHGAPGDEHRVDVRRVGEDDDRPDRVDHRRRVDRIDVEQDDVGLLARRQRADPVLEPDRARSVDRRELEHVRVRQLSARTPRPACR